MCIRDRRKHQVLILHFVPERRIGLQIAQDADHIGFGIGIQPGIPGDLMAGQAAAVAEHIPYGQMRSGIGIVHFKFRYVLANRILQI